MGVVLMDKKPFDFKDLMAFGIIADIRFCELEVMF